MSHTDTEAIVTRHRSAMGAYAHALCPDREAAGVLVEEALERIRDASTYYGGSPETAWLPYLLATVRRVAGDWASAPWAHVLAPDFRMWFGQAAAAFGPEDTMLCTEENSPVLRAYNALSDRPRAVIWHTVIEAEPDPTGNATAEAEAALDGLRVTYLRLLAEQKESPDCQHYSRILGAIVRGTNQHSSEDFEAHLDDCYGCSSAYHDLMTITADRGEPRRTALAEHLLLWGHTAYLAARDLARLPPPLPPYAPEPVGIGRRLRLRRR